MKTYFRILSYASPFSVIIPLYLFLTSFYIVFSMINFSIMIPLLEVLFNQVENNISQNNLNNSEFTFSIQYIKSTFYNYFNEIIQSNGRKEALKFVCGVILISVFFANIFKYFSALIIAKVRVRIVTNIRNSLYEKITNFKINFFTTKKERRCYIQNH